MSPRIFCLLIALVALSTGLLADEPVLARLDRPGLENLLRINERLYSGGEPQGPQAFEELARLGIKTIVSVDGATPKVEAARRAGLRYVHIPIGYDGIPTTAQHALTRLARDVEGPVFLHCHHGKHRGPAAAAVVCRAAGSLDADGARRLLEQAGTGKNYVGLWRDVAQFQPPAASVVLPPLVESARRGTLTERMAAVDRHFDHLRLLQKNTWRTPPEHPDLASRQEALLLRESFLESGRDLPAGYDARFRAWLAESTTTATTLERAIEGTDFRTAARLLEQLERQCQQCHTVYRDAPWSSAAGQLR